MFSGVGKFAGRNFDIDPTAEHAKQSSSIFEVEWADDKWHNSRVASQKRRLSVTVDSVTEWTAQINLRFFKSNKYLSVEHSEAEQTTRHIP